MIEKIMVYYILKILNENLIAIYKNINNINFKILLLLLKIFYIIDSVDWQ